jgi:flavodoxin I
MFRFDHRDPQLMVVYTGSEHAVPDDYRNLSREWADRLATGERFGVIVVYEPHEHHDDDHDEERDRQNETEITRLTNDFRRDYRDQTAQINVGWARVFPVDWKEKYWKEPGDWDRSQEGNNRYAQYSWGIPGNIFIDFEEAKRWILDQFERQPVLEVAPATVSSSSQQRIGLYYGSSTGVTEDAAFKIRDAWVAAGLEPLEPINIGYIKDAAQFLAFDYLLLGISTWNIGELQDDWAILFPQLEALDFTGKKVALFGIGDQYNYPDNFLDAVGILGETLQKQGAELYGFWSTEHYEFAASKALMGERFMGLGIDNVHQSKLTTPRINQWVAQVIQEFALTAAVAS